MIAFACSHCGRKLQTPDHQAGKKAKCPGCHKLTPIPQPATTPAIPAAEAPTLAPPIDQPTSESATLAPNGTQPHWNAASLAHVAIPGYEILAELGRGGMGVIYKARQLSPRRFVALKMILSGEHAGAEDRARFHREAEAVAQLSHPNIVPIHQVGEHQGRPYLTLEFVEGGNLAERLREKSYDFRAAAELVRQLAQAVAFAHQRGIIHRDLKPANVLLTSDGTPKIADFGLAKQLEGSLTPAAQTQSGAIMGTPSYMAPEQAQGKSKNVGKPADIYALGAILYELLTGKPPFQAETTIDTLVKVTTEEPTPPRKLRKKCPRDLETICLKCLRKLPGKRYADAGELADDLRRWLDGEPIQARPIGRIERFARLLRRRKEIVYLAAAVNVMLLLFLTAFVLLSPKKTDNVNVNDPKDTLTPLEKNFADVAKIKKAATRMTSSNNLKQLAMAMHNVNATYGFLPPAAITDRKSGKPLLSWRVAILPFLDQAGLYSQFKRDEPWDSPHNVQLLPRMPKLFALESSKVPEPGSTFFQVFVGPGTAFEPTKKPHKDFGFQGLRMVDFSDGTANTFLIVEAADAVPWTKPDDLSFDPRSPDAQRFRLGGAFDEGILASLVDGSVRFLRKDISERTLRNLIRRNDGEALLDAW